MMAPLFSIIVPVYNAEKYLRLCLDSALNQTFPFFEVVVCNDGSTDSSLSIIREFVEKDPRFKVIDKENGGVTSARQACLDVSRGSYIVCMDADDTMEENCLEEFAKTVDIHNPDIICCGINELYGSKAVAQPVNMPFGHYSRHKKEQEIFPIMFEAGWGREIRMTFWAKAVRKSLFAREHKLLDSTVTIGEDNAVMISCFYRAKNVDILPQCLYNYRKSDTSVINSGKARPFGMLKTRVQYYKDRVDINTFCLAPSFYRSVVHSLFNFSITQFYRSEKKRVIKKDIEDHLQDPFYSEIIEKCCFPAHTKGAMALKALKKRQYCRMKIYSMIKKGRF